MHAAGAGRGAGAHFGRVGAGPWGDHTSMTPVRARRSTSSRVDVKISTYRLLFGITCQGQGVRFSGLQGLDTRFQGTAFGTACGRLPSARLGWSNKSTSAVQVDDSCKTAWRPPSCPPLAAGETRLDEAWDMLFQASHVLAAHFSRRSCP